MSGAEHDSIVEYATGKITSIDHKKKEYSEVTLAEMEAQMKAAAAEMEKASAQMKQQMEGMPPAMREKMEKMMGGVAEATTVTKGGTRKVAGYDCQDYTIAMGQAVKTQTCNTTALDAPRARDRLQAFRGHGLAVQGHGEQPDGQGDVAARGKDEGGPGASPGGDHDRLHPRQDADLGARGGRGQAGADRSLGLRGTRRLQEGGGARAARAERN